MSRPRPGWIGLALLLAAAAVAAYLLRGEEPSAQLRRAEAAWEAGRFADAAAAYGEYLEDRPESVAAHCRRGFSLHRAGLAAAGLEEIVKAVELDGAHVPSRLFLARRAEEANDPAGALAHYERAAGSRAASIGRARLLLVLGRTGAALSACRKFLSWRDPDGEFAHVRLALGELLLFRSFLFLRERDREDAMGLFRQVEATLRESEDGASLAIRARALLRLHRAREALYDALRPLFPAEETLVLRAGGHDAQGDSEGAERLLAEARRATPGLGTDLRIARFWMERGDAGRLRSSLRAARAERPGDVELRALDSFARAVDGEAEDAFAALVPHLREIVGSGDALRLFVRVARLADAGERALALLSKEEETRHFPLARAALRMGTAESREAVGAYRGADPLDPETLLVTGEIRHRFSGAGVAAGRGEAERYAVLARRLAASRMATSGDRLRREAALRGYAASAEELRVALTERDRGAM